MLGQALIERFTKPIGPRRFRGPGRPRIGNVVVVCAGDSITNGLMSANYVSALQHDLGSSYDVVNAGVNGELAWNLLQRLDDIVACQPNVVTVLIGTNDAAAHIEEGWRDDYVKRQHLPQQPTLDWYRASLARIVDRLRSETSATVALLEIPMLGEDLDSAHNRRIDEFNATIHAVGARAGVKVLDVHERLVAALPGDGRSRRFDGSKRLMGSAVLQRLLFRRAYDEISERHGMALLTDHVHLNDRAAAIVAQAIIELVVDAAPPGIEVQTVAIPTRDGGIRARRYSPLDQPATGALLWLHGGGFVGGSIDMPEGDAVARALAQSGITVLSVDYRLVPPVPWATRWRGSPAVRFPGPVQDCLAAWRWLLDDVQRRGRDDGPIVIGGTSAGANLATIMTLRLAAEPRARPDGVALVYPLLHAALPDLGDGPFTPGSVIAKPAVRWMARCFVGAKGLDQIDDAFPCCDALEGFPPTMVVTAERDPLRSSGVTFATDLQRAGLEVRHRVQRAAGHGYLNRPGTPPFDETIASLDAWLGGLGSSSLSQTGHSR